MTDYINQDLGGADLRGLVDIKSFHIGGVDDEAVERTQLTPKEIVLGESLLTPGLQTVITFQNMIHLPSGKNFDKFKNQGLFFDLERNFPDKNGNIINFTMNVMNQTIYRMDNRAFKPLNVSSTEEFSIHACHPTLLMDAKDLVSKSWKCVKPTDIVEHIFTKCLGLGPNQYTIDPAESKRDYIAENIHPFQVINQQASVALYQGHPDYVHFMTYAWNTGGDVKHHFRSLRSLCNQSPVATYYPADAGLGIENNAAYGGYMNPQAAISFEFPCDFDILSDALNGIDENGQDRNTIATVNPVLGQFFTKAQTTDCGIGQYNYKLAISNADSTKQQDSCNLDVEKHLLERQARMSLLDRDKIALRMVVPWNSDLHAGKIIQFLWPNKYDDNSWVYGQGTYLITSLTHVIRYGGFSTTSIDCVTNTAGLGLTGRA